MEPGALGLRPLSISWLTTVPEMFAPVRASLQELFDKYLLPVVTFVRKNLTETVGTVDNNLAQSCLRLLESIMVDYLEQRQKALTDDEVCHLHLERMFAQIKYTNSHAFVHVRIIQKLLTLAA
jgi:dynein heavy chain